MPLPRSLLRSSHGDLDLRLVAGTWPDDVSGEVFLSAPDPDPSLGYALFGFGVMIRLSLRPGTHGADPGTFPWRARTIDSPTRRLYETDPGLFSTGPLGFESPLGSPNMVNTAPLPWGDRLLATWDVGRPTEIDPVTLGFLGEIGSKASWGGGTFSSDQLLPFIFSSAHPVVDPDRDCLWTVKLAPGGWEPFAFQPVIVRYDGDGPEVRSWPVAGARVGGSMHTITQTRDWLVLVDSGNFKVDMGEMATGVRTVRIDEEVPAYLVRKDDLERTPAGVEVPATVATVAPSTGHYYAAYDDTDGVRILFEHMDLMDLGYHLAPDDVDALGEPVDPALVGMYSMALGPSSVSEVALDPTTGRTTDRVARREPWAWNHQLSAMDWSVEGTTSPTHHHVLFQGCRPEAVSRRAMVAYRDRMGDVVPAEPTAASLVTYRRGGLDEVARYEFPSLGDLPSSPAFAPRHAGGDPARSRYAGPDPGGHDGYVVCPVLSDDGFRVELFDAADPGRGPVATLAAPGGATVPLLLHASWAPGATAAPDRERLAFADDVGGDHLDALPDRAAAAVRSVIDGLDA